LTINACRRPRAKARRGKKQTKKERKKTAGFNLPGAGQKPVKMVKFDDKCDPSITCFRAYYGYSLSFRGKINEES